MSSGYLGRYTGSKNNEEVYCYYESGTESESESVSDSDSESRTPKSKRVRGASSDESADGDSGPGLSVSERDDDEVEEEEEEEGTGQDDMDTESNFASNNSRKRRGGELWQIDLEKKRRDLKVLKDRASYTLDEVLVRLQFFLEGTNTVLETLSSLNRFRKRVLETKGLSRSKEEVEYVTNGIELLTDLLDSLEGKQIVEDVYSVTRKDVSKLILEECTDKSSLLDDVKDKVWFFKWFKNLTETYGPFSNREMQYWKDTYFKDGVIVRFGKGEKSVDSQSSQSLQSKDWVHIACLTFISKNE